MQPPGPAGAADAHLGRALAVPLVLVVLATAVYFVLPVPGRMRAGSWALLFSCGVVVLGLLTSRPSAACCERGRMSGSVAWRCCWC